MSNCLALPIADIMNTVVPLLENYGAQAKSCFLEDLFGYIPREEKSVSHVFCFLQVDSLKTVVEMKNAEIHDLRGQVIEMDRLSSELEAARDRAKALQAKTEDLQAQMEKKALQERL